MLPSQWNDITNNKSCSNLTFLDGPPLCICVTSGQTLSMAGRKSVQNPVWADKSAQKLGRQFLAGLLNI